MHVLFTEDGEMDKRVFLATWKDIPVQNEVQYEISNVQHNAGLCNNQDVYRSWTVVEFKFLQAWKVMESDLGPGKSTKWLPHF